MRVQTFQPLVNPLGQSPSVGSSAHRVYELVEGDSIRETVDTLLREAGATRAEIEAHGRVDALRLRGAASALGGEIDLMSLRGVFTPTGGELRFIGVDANGTVKAGVLDDARAVELELQLRLFVGTVVEAPTPAPAPTSWANVAAASALAQAADENPPMEQPSPRLGDRVVHATFGECVVEKMEEGDDFIFVRSKTQRLLRLSLDILKLELLDEPGGREGRRRFAARVTKPTKGRPGS